MKKIRPKQIATLLLASALMGVITGCVKDPSDYNLNNLPPKEGYFNFLLSRNAELTVNYDIPGLRTIIEVYDQNPMSDDTKTKKEGINPIYAAYTNDGKYEGIMNIPTAVTEAYLYASSISAEQCIKLNVTKSGFSYDATQPDNSTRGTWFNPDPDANKIIGVESTTKLPYKLISRNGTERKDNMYSIMGWMLTGRAPYGSTYFTTLKTLGAENEKVGVVSERILTHLNTQRDIDQNASLLRNPKDINLRVPASATGGMSVNVTFMGEQAAYHNTFGYYYYEDKGDNYTLSPAEFYAIKKYIIIPNAEKEMMTMTAGETVKLLYFDQNGNQSEKFPANYVIGWFLIGNGFGQYPPNGNGYAGSTDNGYIRELPASAYTTASMYTENRYSCMSDDTGSDRRFISLYDKKSKLRVIGIEDNPLPATPDDYMDLLFVVQTTPDLGGGELPPIGPEDPDPVPGVWSVQGTLAFEDIWPYGGDYDLNDVIVEYNRDIIFDSKNAVTKIKETFKPVQKPGSAYQDNYFACQYINPGKITLPSGVLLESSTNSIVVEASAKTIAGNSYTVERDMTGLGMKQEDAQNDFNPYIITKNYTTSGRVEVHLPLYDMTSAADKSLMNKDNAYYISPDGIYPFAINIRIVGFIPADEMKKIDSPGQYPTYTKWATSKGEQAKDWYLQDKGKK